MSTYNIFYLFKCFLVVFLACQKMTYFWLITMTLLLKWASLKPLWHGLWGKPVMWCDDNDFFYFWICYNKLHFQLSIPETSLSNASILTMFPRCHSVVFLNLTSPHVSQGFWCLKLWWGREHLFLLILKQCLVFKDSKYLKMYKIKLLQNTFVCPLKYFLTNMAYEKFVF